MNNDRKAGIDALKAIYQDAPHEEKLLAACMAYLDMDKHTQGIFQEALTTVGLDKFGHEAIRETFFNRAREECARSWDMLCKMMGGRRVLLASLLVHTDLSDEEVAELVVLGADG